MVFCLGMQLIGEETTDAVPAESRVASVAHCESGLPSVFILEDVSEERRLIPSLNPWLMSARSLDEREETLLRLTSLRNLVSSLRRTFRLWNGRPAA